jgi:hypothetical protein
MIQFWQNKTTQVSLYMLVFALIPAGMYWFGIRPNYSQILELGKQSRDFASSSALPGLGILPEGAQEGRQIAAIREHFTRRLKQVDTPAELLKFSNLLADALAEEARNQGLRVMHVEMEGQPIKGKYLPAGQDALSNLRAWRGVVLDERVDVQALMNLTLPSQVWQMTVQADYSKVFRFVDTLGNFPVLVQVVALNVEGTGAGVQYRFKLRGTYWGGQPAAAAGG